MQLKTRSVHIAGVTTSPNGAYMKQVARNLTDVSDGFLVNSRYLIMDRDTKYTEDFRDFLDREGVKAVRCPVRAPNCNAFAERFVRSIKEECLDRMILFDEASLRRALTEYVAHYHTERNHQGVDNRLLEPPDTSSAANEVVYRRERLGGLLNYYYRKQLENGRFVYCAIRATNTHYPECAKNIRAYLRINCEESACQCGEYWPLYPHTVRR